MTLQEYFEGFARYFNLDHFQGFTMQVAAEVAAAHEIGLDFEDLRKFLASRTGITSVAFALKDELLPANTIERILSARREGLIYPKDILVQRFSRDELHEK